MSEQYKNSYRFDGINRADSVTWNPHKLMSVLLQCSTVHFKENVRLSSIEKKGLLIGRLIDQSGVPFLANQGP